MADLILDRGNLTFQSRQIFHGLIPQFHGGVEGQLVLLPHVVSLILQSLFRLLPLAVQLVNFLVQAGNLLGDFLSLLKASLIGGVHLLLPGLCCLQLLLQLSEGAIGRGDGLFDLLHILPALRLFFFGCAGLLNQFLDIVLMFLNLCGNSLEIFHDKGHLLPCAGLIQLYSGNFPGGLFLAGIHLLLPLAGSGDLLLQVFLLLLQLSQQTGIFLSALRNLGKLTIQLLALRG